MGKIQGVLSRRFSLVLIGVVIALIPWTAYLALTLPRRFDTSHWDLTWAGFDVVLIAVLTYMAWAAWSHRQILVATAIVAATLLFCDGWFDVTMSIGTGEQWVTVVAAVLVEIPLAIFLALLARRMILRTFEALPNVSPGPTRLHKAPLFFGEAQVEKGREEKDKNGHPTSPS